jgi:hypothetical protein
MPQIGGKPKKTSSDMKRHFTVVIDRGGKGGTLVPPKEHGLYVSSTPSSAAKKAVTKLCAANKSKKVEFHIREITQGSKKKTYGPYEGYIEKLKEPIELKGRIIRYKPVAKLGAKKGVQKGGKIYTGECEFIFEGPNELLRLIQDHHLDGGKLFDGLELEIERESNKIIIKLKNLKDEDILLLENIDFVKNIFETLEHYFKYGRYNNKSRNKLLDDIGEIKVYFKKYYIENKNNKIPKITETDLFNKIRRFKIAFFTMEYNIGYRFLLEIKEELKKIYNISFDLIGIQKNILDCSDKYGDLFFVIDDYTTLTKDEIIQELKKIVKSKFYIDIAKEYNKKINEEIERYNNQNFRKDLFEQYRDGFDLLKPILIDESGKKIMIDWE